MNGLGHLKTRFIMFHRTWKTKICLLDVSKDLTDYPSDSLSVIGQISSESVLYCQYE